MLTLYAPVSGRLVDVAGRAATIAAVGEGMVASPTRGTVTDVGNGVLALTDRRGRSVEVRVEGVPVALTPLVAVGDEVGFDAPLFALAGEGPWRVSVVAGGDADLLLHAQPGADVAAGEDLFSVGPFACGA